MDKKIEKVSLNELAYYLNWCEGEQLNKDIYNTEDKSYLREKFAQFRDRFQLWLFNLDGKNRAKFAIAVREFYKENKF